MRAPTQAVSAASGTAPIQRRRRAAAHPSPSFSSNTHGSSPRGTTDMGATCWVARRARAAPLNFSEPLAARRQTRWWAFRRDSQDLPYGTREASLGRKSVVPDPGLKSIHAHNLTLSPHHTTAIDACLLPCCARHSCSGSNTGSFVTRLASACVACPAYAPPRCACTTALPGARY